MDSFDLSCFTCGGRMVFFHFICGGRNWVNQKRVTVATRGIPTERSQVAGGWRASVMSSGDWYLMRLVHQILASTFFLKSWHPLRQSMGPFPFFRSSSD